MLILDLLFLVIPAGLGITLLLLFFSQQPLKTIEIRRALLSWLHLSIAIFVLWMTFSSLNNDSRGILSYEITGIAGFMIGGGFITSGIRLIWLQVPLLSRLGLLGAAILGASTATLFYLISR